jgi:hypothetical protein
MELDVNGQINANLTVADIGRAIDARPYPDGWYINLDSGNSDIEAEAEAGGTFKLIWPVLKQRFHATAPVNAAKLKAIFVKYLNGDASWRAECAWKEDLSKAPAVAARDTS